jgi:hypothetical protein
MKSWVCRSERLAMELDLAICPILRPLIGIRRPKQAGRFDHCGINIEARKYNGGSTDPQNVATMIFIGVAVTVTSRVTPFHMRAQYRAKAYRAVLRELSKAVRIYDV